MEGKGTTRSNEGGANKKALNSDTCGPSPISNFNIIYTNSDSFVNKRDELKVLLQTLTVKPSAIIITEVNPKINSEGLQESEFSLAGYNLYSLNIGNTKRRGIIVYVDADFKSSEVEIISNFSEFMLVKICLKSTTVHLGAFYRSPNSCMENDENLLSLLDIISQTIREDVILIGDFNYKNIDWVNNVVSSHSTISEKNFLQNIEDNLLTQYITFPTRARSSDVPSILDLVISNGDLIDSISNLSPLGKSDHSVLHVNCNLASYRDKKCRLNFDKGDYDGLRSFVLHDFQSVLFFDNVSCDNNCVENQWMIFKNSLDEGIKKFIPTTANSFKINSEWKTPLPSSTRKLIKRKHRLWSRFLKRKNNEVQKKYNKVRNLVRKETRARAACKQQDIAKSVKDNPKVFWKYVNSKTKTKKGIGDIHILDSTQTKITITNNQDKADVFSNYFASVFTNEPVHNIPEIQWIMPENSMPNVQFDTQSISKKLDHLNVNKSCGPDNLHPRILKELSPIICDTLKVIYENSLNTGLLPSDWKTSNISVIHKKGPKHNVENYRPISLTCIACKIMESIIRDHLVQYFSDNNLFSNYQYGFIKGRSATLQLLNILDDWTSALDSGKQVEIIYTDFAKAFDKVPHQRMLVKLRGYGLDSKLISWIGDFLCFRTQRVRIDNSYSSPTHVKSGIPQGSVLGPILFVIYINDLPDVCHDLCSLFLFADDAKLYKVISQYSDLTLLTQACQALLEWCDIWCMQLNTDKCKALTLGKSVILTSNLSTTFDIPYNGNIVHLEHVSSIKDLGITIDSELNFKEHIYGKIKQSFSMLAIINRNFFNLDKFTFKLLYKSMVRSLVEYGHSVWNPYRLGIIYDLERVQKRATKMVKGCKRLSYSERLRFLEIPTLKFRRIRGDMIEVFKILNGFYDNSVAPVLLRNHDTRTRGNDLKLVHSRSRLDIRKYNFSSRIVGLWNMLPNWVVLSESVNSFKNNLDKFWLPQDLYYNWEADIVNR